MYLDEATAISHLRGGHELIRLRGGTDTLERLVRRVISWCEYHSCAAHQLRPMLAPIPPPAPWGSSCSSSCPSSSSPSSSSSSTPTTSASSSRPSPFPQAFVSLVSAAHARTAAHLPPPPPPSPAPVGSNGHLISRIFAALTLVGTAISAAWQPAFQAYSPAKEAAAAVLDDALYAVLVEVARLHQEEQKQQQGEEEQQQQKKKKDDDDDDGDGAGGDEDDEEEEDDGGPAQWAHAVLLHAAHAYLWAALSDLPASPHMHDAFLARLRGALQGRKRARGVQLGGGAEWMKLRPGGSGTRAIVAPGPMEAETLMWVLAVGWFLADKRRAMYGGGEEMVGWFADRVGELLGVVGVCERECAVGMVRDFPGTDALRVKWEGLLRGEKFCWLS
ncbi:uncharacterized protein LTHEOB_8598 [Lasiodiplodia theobromae]|uniref:uncharacterized protein n=1 Tax=Lasiodiplodia theobromae TaxID=45133 RepID=UPI0015C39225|nr:uncharacterized protein LTHEOB_8598 [Lasiodiplodia theobromae]KAF4541603.1 hypothetical protein LTHEOB_8598 [Lasiodiplodia theobromae]